MNSKGLGREWSWHLRVVTTARALSGDGKGVQIFTFTYLFTYFSLPIDFDGMSRKSVARAQAERIRPQKRSKCRAGSNVRNWVEFPAQHSNKASAVFRKSKKKNIGSIF